MSANTSISLPLLLALTRKKTPLLEQIEKHEKELMDIEMQAAILKGKIELLKKRHAESVVLKWRDEIRGCMQRVDNGEYILVTPQQVVSCIEYKNSIAADRNIKNKIATTLSLMHREGEIGRVESDNGSIYGHKSLFKNDLKTLKNERRH